MLSLRLRNAVTRHSRILLAISAIFLTAPAALQASPITGPLVDYTFHLVFTSPSGAAYSGTGTMIIQAPAVLAGFTEYAVTKFTVVIDPHGADYVFDLSDHLSSPTNPTFQFTDADLLTPTFRNLQWGDTDAAGGVLGTTGNYLFTPSGGTREGGTITMSYIAPTPEPSSIALLGTGLFAGAGGFYRRYMLKRS